MPAASSALRAFFGKGFCVMPTTTTSLEATAARTSLTASAWLLAMVSLIAGWMCASSRMLRVMIHLGPRRKSTGHIFRRADSEFFWQMVRQRFGGVNSTEKRVPVHLRAAHTTDGFSAGQSILMQQHVASRSGAICRYADGLVRGKIDVYGCDARVRRRQS